MYKKFLLIIIFYFYRDYIFYIFILYYYRSLDVLGANASESQLHSEDRRRSSFSPRRTSGASSVSGINFINKIQPTIDNILWTIQINCDFSINNNLLIIILCIGYGSEVSDSRDARSHGSFDANTSAYNSKSHWRSGYKKCKYFWHMSDL